MRHGQAVLYFAERGYEVHGLDSDAQAVRVAAAALKRRGLRARLRRRDMNLALPYKDAFFDAVIATRSIHHTTTKRLVGIFSEIDRVLRPGGILFLQVPGYDKGHEQSRQDNNEEVRWLDPHTTVPLAGPEKGIPHHTFDRKELARFLKRYKIIEIHANREHYRWGYCVIAQRQ